MRKILSFLALLVVGFALPWQAMAAWNFGGGTDPYKLVLHFNNNVNGDHEMTFKDGVWTMEFASTLTYVNFTVRPHWKNSSNQTGSDEYYSNQGVIGVGKWSGDLTCAKDANQSYYISGISANKTYVLSLTGDGANDKFKIRVDEKKPTYYLFINDYGANKYYKVGEFSESNNYTISSITLENRGYFLSTYNGEEGDWDNVDGKLYSTGSWNASVTSGSAITFSNQNGSFKPEAGEYTISINVDKNTITFVKAEPIVTPWDFSKVGKPSELKVAFYNMFSGKDASKTLNYSNGVWSTDPFVAPESGTFDFWIEALSGDDWQHICHNMTRTALDGTTWTTDSDIADGSALYHQANVTKGATYVFRVTGDSENSLKWLFEETIAAPATYPEIQMATNSGTLSTANSENGVYTFSLNLDAWTYFFFKTADGTYYIPQNNAEIPVEDCAVQTKTHAEFNWHNSEAGEYTIVLDTNNKTLKATKGNGGGEDTYPTLYLYQDRSNNWSDKAAGQATSTDGKYTFSVDLDEGGIFIICTDPDGITGWNFNSGTILYGQDGRSEDMPIGKVGDRSNFKERGLSGNDGKYGWKVTKTGRYTIEVDVTNEWLEVTGYSEPVVIDPVDPSNSKTIYFDNTSSKWSSVRVYLYSPEMVSWGSAPDMTPIGNNIYSYTFSGDCKYVIFYNGSNDQNKTGDNVDVIDGHVYKSDSTHKVYDPEDYKVKLYMYTNAKDWSDTPKASAEETANGTYTFTVSLNANDYFAFSSKSSISKYDGGIEMTPGGDVTIGGASDKVVTDFKSATSGAWKANATGTYKLRINKNTGKLKVLSSPAAAAAVRLPLTSADFADGKKHFFLVGDRMGEWKLQPEWELADNGDGTYSLSNRFIYNTDFAVAVVDNFEDYSNHCYRWYASNTTLGGSTVTTSAFTSNGVNERYAGETQYNGSNKFHANWDTDYWQGAGEFMSQIKLTVTNGLPSRLDFTKGTTAQKTRNRLFTLVGEGFYNNRFNNEMYNGVASNVRTYRSNLTGSKVGDGNAEKAWQDSWIQYNPNTQRPYVDANNEYLYHTSFTPDYLTKNPVLFSRTLSGNLGQFPFSSSSIQFVDADQLDTEDDPYRDFYKSINSRFTIDNSGKNLNGGEDKPELNTKYNYNVKTYYNNTSYTQTPTGDWHCLVVKDMWVEGEFKFWSGWGGNTRRTHGISDDKGGKSATWHGPNGGPMTTFEVEAFDVTEGKDATIYKSQRNKDGVNYKTKDGALQYYNRVILWYNEEGEVPQSFMQFIQENAGPAIFAQNYSEGGNDNYLKYTWYVQKPDNASEAATQGERKVVGYKIHRYQRTDGENKDLGYNEGSASAMKKVPTDREYFVKDFYRDSNTRPDWVQNVPDYGQGGRGFDPGLYYYTITLYYEKEDGSISKMATSNEVPIYADELVTPEVMAYQIIELTDKAAAKEALGTDGQGYLTYSGVAGTPIYAFNIIKTSVDVVDRVKDGETVKETAKNVDVEIPAEVKQVNRAAALNYLRDNQDKTLWTSDWYVRTLDMDDYNDALQAYKDNGILVDEVLPTPTVKITNLAIEPDPANPNAGNYMLSYAAPFSLNNNHYYSAIVRRGGNLTDAYFIADLSYKYNVFATDASGNPSSEVKYGFADSYTSVYPVMPKPYGAVYRYKVTDRKSPFSFKDEEVAKAHYGRVAVPVNNSGEGYNDNEFVEEKADVLVSLDDDFGTRSMNLEVDFFRPNVAKDIFKWYDIHYEVGIDNDFADLELDVTATMHDTKTELNDADGNDTFNSPYRFEIHGVHPLNAITPTIDFIRTAYESRDVAHGESRPDGLFQGNEATFGPGISIKCESEVNVGTSEIGSVHLGYIENSDNPDTLDWMYKGHSDFKDNNENLTSPGNDSDKDDNGQDIIPFYYLIQLDYDKQYNVDVNHTYEYLVPHYEDHTPEVSNKHSDSKVGIDLADTDPLIGTYIARGLPKVTDSNGNVVAPNVTVTAMYIFERPVYGESDSKKIGDIKGLNDLEMVGITYPSASAAATSSKATSKAACKVNLRRGPERKDREFTTIDDFIAGKYGLMPSSVNGAGENLVVPEGATVLDFNGTDGNTGYNQYIAVRGATAKVASSDLTVTGVDDILSDVEYDGKAVYYNLQGIRVENPSTPGVYIKVEGRKSTKVVID